GDQPGLHPHRAREGPARARGGLQARASQHAGPAAHHRRPLRRDRAHGDRAHRDRFHAPGPGENAGRCDRRPRLPAGPGRHHRVHDDHHHRQPRGRHALRGRRPADHVPLVAIAVREVAEAAAQTPARSWGRLLRRYAPIGIGILLAGIMRCADMLMAFPTLLLALIIVTALGGSLVNEILAIGVALMPNFVRLARSLALTIRDQDYIMAARGLGSGQLRIMARHVFPNALYALVVVATLYIATAIRTEAGLSFLGLGIPPPTPSWGNMLSEGRQYIKGCPWITTFSGLAIMLAVLAFNLMGDALRDLLDPRLRGE